MVILGGWVFLMSEVPLYHQPSQWGQIACLYPLGLYWFSPESDDLWYRSGLSITMVCSHFEGW